MLRVILNSLAILVLSMGAAQAALQLYPVEQIPNLPEIDDGTGPLAFDFSPFKLASRYDGQYCSFAVNRMLDGRTEAIGDGFFTVDTGHLKFSDSEWRTGGLATPDSYNRANLAITEKGELVGRFPVFSMFVNEGMVPPDADLVTFTTQGGTIGKDQPVGKVKIDIARDLRGEFAITGCRNAGETGPIRPYFDFSKIKVATNYDAMRCSLDINRVSPDNSSPQRIGTALASLNKGKVEFQVGQWETDGPEDSFKLANLAITTDRGIVGIWDVYPLFPDPNPHPPITVTLSGKEGALDKDLKGVIEFPLDNMKGQLVFKSCGAAT